MNSGPAVALSIYGSFLKRFTETNKWRDPWFRKLSSVAKHLWNYLCDNCDNAGVIELDVELAAFFIGEPIDENHLRELESRLQRLPNGKFYIPKFVPFQFGELKPTSIIHRSVIKLLESHALPIPNPMPKVNRMAMGCESYMDKEKVQEKDKEKDEVREMYHPDSRAVLWILNEATMRHFRELDSNLGLISARLKEPEVTLDGVKLMIARQVKRWKGTEQEEYLRPATLFGKSKFDSYYAARELPLNENNGRIGAKGFNRNAGTYNENRKANYDLRVVSSRRSMEDIQRAKAARDVAGG